MPTHVIHIEKKYVRLETQIAIRDKIIEYCPDVSWNEMDASIIALLNFGGEIQFDIPLGNCVLRDEETSVTIEIEISKCPYPLETYKVASVENSDNKILLLIHEVRDFTSDKKTCKILKVYNNTENLTNTELGRLWVLHDDINEHPIKVFEGYGEAQVYFDKLKDNMERVKIYNEIRDQFLHPVPNVNLHMEDI